MRFGCHRLPERSFFIRGRQFPLCARCTGVVTGYALGLGLWWAFRPPAIACALLALPMAVDGGLQRYAGVMSTNLRRVITGLLYGYGVMSLVLRFAAWTFGF